MNDSQRRLTDKPDGRNPIEIAEQYHALVSAERTAEPNLSKNAACHRVADAIGVSSLTVDNYLRLLTFPETVQGHIINGTVTQSDCINLSRKTGWIKNRDENALMQALEDLIREKESIVRDTSSRTRETRKRVRRAIKKPGRINLSPEAAELQRSLRAITSIALKVAEIAVPDGSMRDTVREAALASDLSPEAISTVLRRAVGQLNGLADVLDEAMLPEALPQDPAATPYSEKIGEIGVVPSAVMRMAKLLAQVSDKDSRHPKTHSELIIELGQDAASVHSCLRELDKALAPIGLCIETLMVRGMTPEGKLGNIAAYRLNKATPQSIAPEVKPPQKVIQKNPKEYLIAGIANADFNSHEDRANVKRIILQLGIRNVNVYRLKSDSRKKYGREYFDAFMVIMPEDDPRARQYSIKEDEVLIGLMYQNGRAGGFIKCKIEHLEQIYSPTAVTR